MKNFVMYYEEEWAVLYEDGVLVCKGEQFEVHEYILNAYGVEIRYSNDFFLGRNDDTLRFTAERLEEVEAYTEDIEAKGIIGLSEELQDLEYMEVDLNKLSSDIKNRKNTIRSEIQKLQNRQS